MKKDSRTGAKLSSRKRPVWRASKDQLYEQLKAALPLDLSMAEYEAACRRIARELRL